MISHSLLAQNPETSRVPQTHLSTTVYLRFLWDLWAWGNSSDTNACQYLQTIQKGLGFSFLTSFSPLSAPPQSRTLKHPSEKPCSSSRWRQALYFKLRFKTACTLPGLLSPWNQIAPLSTSVSWVTSKVHTRSFTEGHQAETPSSSSVKWTQGPSREHLQKRFLGRVQAWNKKNDFSFSLLVEIWQPRNNF